MKHAIYTLEQMEETVAKFALTLKVGSLVLIQGSMGSGKTAICKVIIKTITGLNANSPSFQVVNEYGIIKHWDLYHVKDIAHLRKKGFGEDMEDFITLVEWPNIIIPMFDNFYLIQIDYEDNKRTLTINFK